MNELSMTESEAVAAETITTEVLADEGNYRVEIEGSEPMEMEAPSLAPADTGALMEAATEQAMGELAQADIVSFAFEVPQFAPNPLELTAPGSQSVAATPAAAGATTVRLGHEARLAHGFEAELQRGRA